MLFTGTRELGERENAMRRLVIILAAVATGCFTGAAQANKAGLRQRDGICAMSSSDSLAIGVIIRTCAVVGMPGTLYDSSEPRVTTKVSSGANTHSADTGEWQMEVFHNGQPLVKRMMSKHWPPELTCLSSAGCRSWSIDSYTMETGWPSGTYQFHYVFGLDTSLTVTNTIVIE